MFVWNVKYSPGETDRFGEQRYLKKRRGLFISECGTENPPLAIVPRYEKGQENYFE